MKTLRRHHIARLKNNRRNYWGGNNSPKQLGKLAACPASCSCPLCGNDRQFKGDTLKERSNAAKFNDEINDL